MNISPQESPRLVCRLVRWWAALAAPTAAPSGSEPATGHRANCPACRAYFQSHAALETRLRHEAHSQPSAVPAGLEQRIAAAVRRAQIPAHAPQRRARSLWTAGLTTAAAALAMVLILNRGSRPSQHTTEIEPADIAAVFTAVTALPRQFNTLFTPPSSRTAEQDPLSHELDNVKADARSALDFLAANFIPTERRDPASSLRERQSPIQGG